MRLLRKNLCKLKLPRNLSAARVCKYVFCMPKQKENRLRTNRFSQHCTITTSSPQTRREHSPMIKEPMWQNKDVHAHADGGTAAGEPAGLVAGGAMWAWHTHTHTHTHTHSHVICTVTGLVGVGSSRKLIGLSRANGMAGRGLRVTWAAGEAERRKQSVTHSHSYTPASYKQVTTINLRTHTHTQTCTQTDINSKQTDLWHTLHEIPSRKCHITTFKFIKSSSGHTEQDCRCNMMIIPKCWTRVKQQDMKLCEVRTSTCCEKTEDNRTESRQDTGTFWPDDGPRWKLKDHERLHQTARWHIHQLWRHLSLNHYYQMTGRRITNILGTHPLRNMNSTKYMEIHPVAVEILRAAVCSSDRSKTTNKCHRTSGQFSK